MWSEKEKKERERIQAEIELTEVQAVIHLLSNKHLACEVHIAGMKVGLCNTKKVLPALKYQKAEIEKYLKGEKNEWE